MKRQRQWIATGLVFLGVTLPSQSAIANSMRNANLELRTMLCSQNWPGSIRAIDKMKSITSDRRQELNYLRALIVNMRDQGTTVPEWPDTDYCTGANDILPDDIANAQVGDFSTPSGINNSGSSNEPPLPAAAPSPFQSGATTISQSQLEGIWYSHATCQDSDPASGVENVQVSFKGTSEYKSNQQYSDKMYFEFSTTADGQTVAFSGRATTSGTYSLNNNVLTETIQDTSASYDTVTFNGQPLPFELNQEMDQLFDELFAADQVGTTMEFELQPTPDGKLELGQAPGCNIPPAYKVVAPLF